jgi:hypothetical protein
MVLGVAALVGLVGTSSAQFISLDGTTEPILAYAKSNDILLSAELPDATLQEVTNWLNRSRLNFVIDQSALNSDKHATLSFKQVPGRQVLRTIATAYGLEAVENGAVITLRKPDSVQNSFALVVADPQEPSRPVIVPVAPQPPSNGELENAVKQAEAAAKEAEDATDLATAKAAAKKAAEAARKAAALARKSRGVFSFRGPGIESFTLNRKAQEEMKQGMDSFKMDEKSRAELERAMKELRSIEPFKMDDKARAELDRAMKEFGKANMFMWREPGQLSRPLIPSPYRAMRVKPRELMESLTDSQKNLAQTRGYLKLSDLTDKQRQLLGNPEGSFNFSFKIDGKTLEIRGDEKAERPPLRPSSI